MSPTPRDAPRPRPSTDERRTPATRRPRRTDPERRERLIDATLALIVEHGIAGATFRPIAAAADVPLGSINYHFTTRDELLLAAFTRFAERMLDQMQQATTPDDQSDAVEDLADVASGDAHYDRRDRILLAELYVLAYRDERYADLLRRWMEEARSSIARRFPRSDARAVDAVQEGLALQRDFLPAQVPPALVRTTIQAVVDATST